MFIFDDLFILIYYFITCTHAMSRLSKTRHICIIQ
ncbi:hypothetical protein COPEUT_02705 [Coprococcus eutactus ATCC 27759]|nr:hypothetical protein COPEUT_02705 [Coprococcus eutactus ATCC 27759]